MKLFSAVALILFISTGLSLADGKMFWRETVPPNIPYQRALILFDQGTQTLILQSSYEMPEGEQAATLGWVVPVPAVPEVASIPADVAEGIFRFLGWQSYPRVTRIYPIVLGALLIATAILSLVTLLLCIVSFVVPLPKRFMENRGRLARYSTLSFAVVFLVAVVTPTLGTVRGLPAGVEVIAEHRVGIYDVSVVRSEDSAALIDWLNEHDFKFGETDVAAFDSYLSQGWCFVVAIINPSEDESTRSIVSEGLAAPLILRFPHPTPIYPVALTGTGGFETEILIYLAAPNKMTAHDRLTLRSAGAMSDRIPMLLSEYTDPEGFFGLNTSNFSYLSKFGGRLSPQEMSEDITFSPASDNDPYREHIIMW